MYLFRRLFLLVIVWGIPFSTSAGARTPDSIGRVQVSLFDDARVAPGILAQAQARASAIFALAGIEVDWLACAHADPTDFTPSRTACSAVAWPTHLSVRIIPRGAKVAADVFGQAFVDDSGQGVYCNVYYQNLVLSPNHPGISDADMLGYVLAHEVGHLLLGTGSHSATGLMQALWSQQVMAVNSRPSLVFTPSQAALLRSRLAHATPVILTASSRLLAGMTTITTSPPSSALAHLPRR